MPASLGEYALIGDCETAALVAKNGSVDWLCLPRFDSPACFAALLGSPQNGHWQLAPKSKFRASRCYRPDTMILETRFRTAHGTVSVTDFMPSPRRSSRPAVVRILRGERGTVPIRMSLAIRFDYGRTIPWVRQEGKLVTGGVGPDRLTLHASVPLAADELCSTAEFSVRTGQQISLVLQYENAFRRQASPPEANLLLKQTEMWWRKWISRCRYKGPWAGAVRRSLITLKTLTYAPTGGPVAAPTTSLPEVPRGQENWDYRFCWVRDTTFTLLAFTHAGFRSEARRLKDWLIRAAGNRPQQLQVMYRPDGERIWHEWQVPWLSGFSGATPVRVGNAARQQLQLDIYGELVDALYQAGAVVARKASDFELQRAIVGYVEENWRLPDHGIWEFRRRNLHFTHSKAMAWVAFDRTIKTAERFGLSGPIDHWKSIRTQIHREVCRHGFNTRLGSFVQSYGSHQVDASLLLLPLVGFLPVSDPRIIGTVKRIEQRLLRGGLVMRCESPQQKGHAPQQSTSEGAFLPCSLWLVDCYELAGRRAEARRLLKRILRIRNEVGLLSEEYSVEKRKLVGNFPQALSHVALVNAIINFHTARVRLVSGRE